MATTRLKVWEDTTTEKDDDEVVVYGVNCNRHQIIYNTSMWTLGLYGKKGSGKDQFLFPKGITANGDGDVYVADSGNNRIVQLFNPKSKLQWVRSFNGKSDSDGGIIGPSRISIDEDKKVYVIDTGNRRVVVFSADGKVLKRFPEATSSPTALVVADGKAYWSFFRFERILFYAENGGRRIVKCTFNGKIVKTVDLPEGHVASYGATDYYHNYWITDTKNHCVLKYDRHLNLLCIFGSFGTGDNQFVEPRGIAVYKRYGQVFIAEKKGAQYYWVGTDLKSASIDKENNGRYVLTVSATEYSFCSLFSMQNTDTCFYLHRRRIPPYSAKLLLKENGTDLQQQHLTVRLEPTYSSFTYNAWFFPVSIK